MLDVHEETWVNQDQSLAVESAALEGRDPGRVDLPLGIAAGLDVPLVGLLQGYP